MVYDSVIADRLIDLAERLAGAADVLDSADQPLELSPAFHLHQNFPRISFTREQGQETLQSLGLYPNGNVFVAVRHMFAYSNVVV